MPRSEVNKESVLESNALLWTHYWKGGVHPVPEGWVLNKKDCAGHSTMTVKALWELWCFGHPVHRIPPYRKLVSNDLSSYTVLEQKGKRLNRIPNPRLNGVNPT